MYIINFLIGFMSTYFFLFFITFIVTHIASVTMEFKNKDKKQNMVKTPKKQKEVKKTWNESLGVWEID